MTKMLRWSAQNHADWKAREAVREATRQCDELNRRLPIVGTANAQDKPRPKLKLTPTVAPEAAVLDAALKALRLHPKVAWCERMNAGAGRFVYPDGRSSRWITFGFVGMSDILGQLRDGRFLAVECKARTGKATIEQLGFLHNVRHHGGVAFLAYSVDDVMRELAR